MPTPPRTLDVGKSHRFEISELPSFISRQVSGARRYYFDLTGNAKSRLYVVLGGWERVRADYAIRRPDFGYYSIEFVAEGQGRVLLAGKEYELAPVAVFGYSPVTPMEIIASAGR